MYIFPFSGPCPVILVKNLCPVCKVAREKVIKSSKWQPEGHHGPCLYFLWATDLSKYTELVPISCPFWSQHMPGSLPVPTWSFKHLRWPSLVVFSNHTQAESLFTLFPPHFKNIPTPILNSKISISLAKMELVSRAKRTRERCHLRWPLCDNSLLAVFIKGRLPATWFISGCYKLGLQFLTIPLQLYMSVSFLIRNRLQLLGFFHHPTLVYPSTPPQTGQKPFMGNVYQTIWYFSFKNLIPFSLKLQSQTFGAVL